MPEAYDWNCLDKDIQEWLNEYKTYNKLLEDHRKLQDPIKEDKQLPLPVNVPPQPPE